VKIGSWNFHISETALTLITGLTTVLDRMIGSFKKTPHTSILLALKISEFASDNPSHQVSFHSLNLLAGDFGSIL
jgi:hypothetical protein